MNKKPRCSPLLSPVSVTYNRMVSLLLIILFPASSLFYSFSQKAELVLKLPSLVITCTLPYRKERRFVKKMIIEA